MPEWMTRRQVRSQPVVSHSDRALDGLLRRFDARMNRITDEYLRKMGEHIADIGTLWPSDVHRLQQIRRMNRNLASIQRRIAAAANMSADDIMKVFERVANEDARMAAKILGAQDITQVRNNPALYNILKAQARETAGRMRNLSNTTVVSKWYRSAIDEAVTAVQSGVEDYNTAIRRVIREAGQNGLRVNAYGSRVVDYESGYSRRLDTAARMNVLDGARHLNQTIMEEVGRQFGADGVEIDAHMLCAEDHLPYQGGQYSNDDFERIQDGLQRPFGEWNCRHSWHPIMLGISPPTYTQDQLEAFRRYSTEEVTIDGRTKTRYQWSQEMRRCETAIRQQKDTATLARTTGDKVLERRCQGNVIELNRHYEQLAEKAGLEPEFQRTYVRGYRDAPTRTALTGNVTSGKMNVSTGGRRNEVPLTEAQKAECLRIAVEYGMPIERIVFSDEMFTSYFPPGDRLYIGTDVYPSSNTGKANYMISHRGALAHEIIGHRNAYLHGKTQPEDYLEEAQASVRASRAAGLSEEERETLLRDAAERLPEGVTLEDILPLLFLEV